MNADGVFCTSVMSADTKELATAAYSIVDRFTSRGSLDQRPTKRASAFVDTALTWQIEDGFWESNQASVMDATVVDACVVALGATWKTGGHFLTGARCRCRECSQESILKCLTTTSLPGWNET